MCIHNYVEVEEGRRGMGGWWHGMRACVRVYRQKGQRKDVGEKVHKFVGEHKRGGERDTHRERERERERETEHARTRKQEREREREREKESERAKRALER